MRSIRSYLQDIEFVDLTFHYHLETQRVLPLFPELHLRSKLHTAGAERLSPFTFEQLFTPALPDDPIALRRYQRPSPPFSFQPNTLKNLKTTTSMEGNICCHLFGDGILLIDDLIKTMEAIQPFNFEQNQRDGHLDTVFASDASGIKHIIWETSQYKCSNPPRITAAWRIDTLPASNNWRLDIITPARLMVHKKPLFHPYLRHFLPFILRRVTSICYFYNHIEIEGAQELISLLDSVKNEVNQLCWQDWRPQGGDGELTELGGVCGSLLLNGNLAEDLVDLLLLGSLMNIGKGAAYGAGAFRINLIESAL